jgi:hypothetical protein
MQPLSARQGAESGVILRAFQRCVCLTRLDREAFDRLLGQRSEDPVNTAAVDFAFRFVHTKRRKHPT